MSNPEQQHQTQIDELESQVAYLISILEEIKNKPGLPDSINDIIISSLARARLSEPVLPIRNNFRNDLNIFLTRYGL